MPRPPASGPEAPRAVSRSRDVAESRARALLHQPLRPAPPLALACGVGRLGRRAAVGEVAQLSRVAPRQFSVSGDIAAGIRELFNDCCREPQSCQLLATTANKCDRLTGRRFVMIDAVEYYIGGQVFTVLVDDPVHRILFVWWRDPHGIVYVDEPVLTSAERDRIAARHAHILEYARTIWPVEF